MNRLSKFTDNILNICLTGACIYLLLVLISCFLQVFSRYVLNSSFGWTEELARYSYAGLGMIGAPVALRKGLHVTVNILEEAIKGKEKMLLVQKIIISIIVFIVSTIILIYGIIFINKTGGLYSSVMRLPMILFYYVIPLSGIISMWVVAIDSLETVNKFKGIRK